MTIKDTVRESVDRSIASANVMWRPFIHNGKRLLSLVAMRSINANEQLGIDYGPNYWIGRKKIPKYFNILTGSVLELSVLNSSNVSVTSVPRRAAPTFKLQAGFLGGKSKPSTSEKEKEFRNAANQGKENDVRRLIAENVNINAPSLSNGRTALHYAVINNRSSIVRLLVATGANLEILDHEHKLPVDYAQNNVELRSIFSISPQMCK